MSRLGWPTLISVAAGMVAVGWLSQIVLRNGTHAVYCPAATKFWIFACLPTLQAIGVATALTAVVAICVFPVAWVLSRFRR
ncbi:hypothetical protein ACI3KW_11480 [Devosia sp. ZW T5_3]|uniref:hypothetical protein n=1 Tax=Devosia sp. ZW T5_3 TaxID=3378085 RepID=UPI0038537CC3